MMADRQGTRIVEALRARQGGKVELGPWVPRLGRGIVTAGTGPWTVAALLEDGTAGEQTWGPCWTAPRGGSVAVGNEVVLLFERPDVPPSILATGGGSAGDGGLIGGYIRFFAAG